MVRVARLRGDLDVYVYHNEPSYKRPHVHVIYPDDHEVEVAVDSIEILVGRFKRGRERRAVLDWVEQHREALERSFRRAQAGETIERLDP